MRAMFAVVRARSLKLLVRRRLGRASERDRTPANAKPCHSCHRLTPRPSRPAGRPCTSDAWLLNGPFGDWDVDEELRRRARFYHRLAPSYEAHYGIFTGRPAHLDDGLAGIRARL